jgi:hypothetical protein
VKTAPFAGLMALLAVAPSAFAAGEVARLPKIKSLAELKKEVELWAKYTHQRLSESDVLALTAWLNKSFFRLRK